jgi:N-acetylmuramoyl-L-alanine amidase
MKGTRLDHTVRPAVNFSTRRDGKRADMLLLHYTGMETPEAACEKLCAVSSGVSCHYFVDEDGTIVQMVDEDMRAWHAGVSFWKGETDINSRSIGIEIHNHGHNGIYTGFPDAQMASVIALCSDIVQRHGIAPERVLGHSDVSPGRKLDPGEKFDWRRLNAAGIGHWVEPVPVGGGIFMQAGEEGEPVAALQGLLAAYGYGIEVSGRYDAATVAVVEAFQRHFRTNRVDGVADRSTIETLKRLIDALPKSPIA